MPTPEEIIENLRRYDAALNELELPPNGDDYNNLWDMIEGGQYRAPHEDGR